MPTKCVPSFVLKSKFIFLHEMNYNAAVVLYHNILPAPLALQIYNVTESPLSSVRLYNVHLSGIIVVITKIVRNRRQPKDLWKVHRKREEEYSAGSLCVQCTLYTSFDLIVYFIFTFFCIFSLSISYSYFITMFILTVPTVSVKTCRPFSFVFFFFFYVHSLKTNTICLITQNA